MDDSLICVVDDEQGIRDLLSEAVEMKGHRVEAFEDGESFLSFTEGERPDLVFLDINMPGASGWEVQQAMSEDPDLADAPVVAVTAQGGDSIEASAQEGLGFEGFLRKPFDLHRLFDEMEDLLQDR